ncbi:MAG: ATP-binding protein [Gammaproteobacteria bacterium]
MSLQTNSQYSLQSRLVLAFSILLILFLGLAGFVLDRVFKESVAAAVEERLQLQIYALLGVAEPDRDGFFIPDLEELRFSQINSGLYGFILNTRGEEVWRSPSAINLDLDEASFMRRSLDPGQSEFGTMESSDQGRLSFASYGTYWSSLDAGFSFVVMESSEPTTAEIREFQSSLYLWFGGLAILLSIAQLLLLRWGMHPLKQLAGELSSIEAGEKDRLELEYPRELQGVSNNLNLLVKSERERQSRYRTTLGDLAHSLKTPLAVIGGIVHQARLHLDESDKERPTRIDELEEQMARMNQIVSYQLKRASSSGTTSYLGVPVRVAPLFEKVTDALEKVYREKGVRLLRSLESNSVFRGEESDLMELAGNLLDNAFKYCKSEIRIRVGTKGDRLQLEIEDDGKGIPKEDRGWVMQRGARGDTLNSGQGIGLAVSVDIVNSYGGDIRVDTGELGGACIRVTL